MSFTKTFLGPPKATHVMFFDNGTAGVWDQYDDNMPQFMHGDHATTVRLLKNAGIDWWTLHVVGSPRSTREAWALERERDDPEGCGLVDVPAVVRKGGGE